MEGIRWYEAGILHSRVVATRWTLGRSRSASVTRVPFPEHVLLVQNVIGKMEDQPLNACIEQRASRIDLSCNVQPVRCHILNDI